MATRLTATQDARGRLLAEIPAVERRLTAAGISTAVLEGGDGAPLLLLHGPAGNAAHWMRVIAELARTHLVIAPDLPGHGASAAGDAEHMADWLGELIEATCPEPPTLVGLAAGGAIAARFAADHGDRIGRLVLVDSLGLTDFDPTPEFGAALTAFLQDPSERTHDGLWRYCALDFDRLRERMGERWEPFRAYNVDRATRPGAMAALGGLMERFGMRAIAAGDLARIAVPTALIWGRDDLATSLSVAEAASERYGWPLHVIEDCADDPPLEQPEAFVRALRAALGPVAFKGELVGRADERYDELRKVYNGMVDRRPAFIARCTDSRDVAAAVTYAGDAGLPLSVYGGGHNVTGNAVCDDGVTIDLRPMKRVEIDPLARVCRAEAGLTWGELDAATQEHGLAVTGGRMSTTGIGGLVLGGGSGWIERKCGYSVDNLLAVEFVTADGRILTASETEHPELFWAARGAGANFGVATRFELRLHPIGPTVLGGILIYPAPMAAAVLRNFRDTLADAPDEVGAGVALITAPHHDFVPEPVRGQPVVGVFVCYAGPVREGEEALRPLREFGPPAVDLIEPMPYVAVQQLLDADYPSGMRNYWTGEFLTGLPDEAIDVMVRFHASKPSPLGSFFVLAGGGAAGRVPGAATVLDQRAAPFNFHITSLWADPADDEANIVWTRELSAAMQPFATGRVYVNFIDDEGQDRTIAAYGGPAGYARLQAIKDRYDPGNLFRGSLNVKPTRS
ncbi:MAG TPA: alpha/beta fold hydrolase [Solirubrobacteraceae bacterium]|nr:alpha/beta fold hydrolase [Solirubrobacteraceae bacterium]